MCSDVVIKANPCNQVMTSPEHSDDARIENLSRRAVLAGAVGLAMAGAAAPTAAAGTEQTPTGSASTPKYGLIGKMTAQPGQRDALIAVLLEGMGDMPGCLSYVVAKDAADENGIWISEVWIDKQSHDASLSLPAVKNAIAKGRPLIAGFSNSVTTVPIGGVGLPEP